MPSKGQQTGMRGVYLMAAELVARGFIVSTTSRKAMGADLLVTDDTCAQACSVQVKTNARPASFRLVGERAKQMQSPSHIYVLVNLRDADSRHEFFIVPSSVVATKTRAEDRAQSTWYAFSKSAAEQYRNNWKAFEAPPEGAA